MGKVIRCVDCQTPIRIPEVESPLLRTGNWVECRAKRAIKKTDFAAGIDLSQQDVVTNLTDAAGTDPPTPIKPSIDSTPDATLPLTLRHRPARLLRAKPWRTVEPLTHVDPEDVLTPIELDESPKPVGPLAAPSPTSSDPEPAKELVDESDAPQPQKLSLISRLLWFVNPSVKEPPKSA